MLTSGGKERETLQGEEGMASDDAGRHLVLQVALTVFLAADNEDRAGKATRYCRGGVCGSR